MTAAANDASALALHAAVHPPFHPDVPLPQGLANIGEARPGVEPRHLSLAVLVAPHRLSGPERKSPRIGVRPAFEPQEPQVRAPDQVRFRETQTVEQPKKTLLCTGHINIGAGAPPIRPLTQAQISIHLKDTGSIPRGVVAGMASPDTIPTPIMGMYSCPVLQSHLLTSNAAPRCINFHPTNLRIIRTTATNLALRDSIMRAHNTRTKRALVSITPHTGADSAGSHIAAQIVKHLVVRPMPPNAEEDCKPSSPTFPGRQVPAPGAAVESPSSPRLRLPANNPTLPWMLTTILFARQRTCGSKMNAAKRRKQSRRAVLRQAPRRPRHQKVASASL